MLIFIQNNIINDTDLVNLIQGEGRNRNKELTEETIYYIQES